jgi:uncharacterized membrane protein
LTRLERSIGVVLHAGVITSSVLLAVGLLLTLAGVSPDFGDLLLHVGILILICTPAARVAISTVGYAAARDWPFMTLTLIVLAELLASAAAALVFNRRL